ncbi:MAG: hypothetical protein QOI21_3794 [Actinomycetota bacterium]|jgi:hypothetical protein|nr:hypothetical protein [Actinomycetota bacterium]
MYSAWLLEFLLPTRVSPVHDPVRELTEAGMPYRDLFRAAAGVSGLAFLLSGPPLVRLAPVHWTARLSAASVSLLGILLLVGVAYPGIAGIDLLINLAFVAGAGSLVLWWPQGWRQIAIAGLVMVLATWLAMLVLMLLGPGHFIGIVSRVQMLGRALLLAIGASYLFRGELARSP